MKKRVAYIIMTVMLLLLTIGQTVIPAFAGSTKQSASDVSQLSSTIDYSKVLSNSSSLSEVVANSQTSSQSSVTTSSSQQPSKASVSQSTTSQPAAKKTTKVATSQSVMIKPKALTGDAYPDFSQALRGQANVESVDVVNPTQEIEYPYNAFPNYIPGVSTQKVVGLTMGQNGLISGDQLDGSENHYIQYSKVMTYVDGQKKHHWIDVKEAFIKLDQRGWYKGTTANGEKAVKAADYLKKWSFLTGLGAPDAGVSTYQKMLGIASTISEPTYFYPQLAYPASGGKSIMTEPDDLYDFNQPIQVRLLFTDHDTGQPINISGFLTVADLDYRDYIDFDTDSNIKQVYVSDQSELKGTTVGKTQIVNRYGNQLEFKNGTIATHLPNSDGAITEDTTDQGVKVGTTSAWATIVFENTSSLNYKISDQQEFNFLPTALVPVAFSAPAKDGDGDTYNSNWDDSDVRYNMVTTLPYRGGIIDNPDPIVGGKISTFKPSTEFKLSDDLDANLSTTKADVKVLDQTGKDVSASFDISVTGNQVVANANSTFLNDETNYAQPYTLQIDTTVNSGADLSAYEQVDANGKTYAKIPNTGKLTVIKKAGADEVSYDSNEAYGHVETPKVVQQKATVKQEIKNDNESTWHDDETDGQNGDTIDYRFTVAADGNNSDDLLKAKIQDITNNDSDLTLVPGSLKVQIGVDAETDGNETQFNDHLTVAVGDIPAGKTATVTYQMKVKSNEDKDVTNGGNLYATNLDNETDATHLKAANPTVLHLTKQTAAVDTLTQTVENITAKTAAEDKETEGGQDDQIQYAFTAHIKADTGSKLKGLTLKTQENDSTASYTDADGVLNDDAKQYDTEYKIVRADGTDEGWQKVDSGDVTDAIGSIQIKLPGDQVALSNDDTVTVHYSKSIKTVPAENKYLYNDGSVGDTKANYTRIKPLSDGKITVRYLDRESDMASPTTVSSEVTYVGKIGTKLLDSTTTPDATGSSPKTISGWTVVDYTGDTDLPNATYYQAAKNNPVFAAGDQVITYRYEKKAIGLKVPAHWYFGSYGPSDTEQTYYLKAKDQVNGKTQPYELQVRDYYGVNSWSVDATQSTQFKTTEDVNGNRQTLTGAQLQFTNGTVLANQSTDTTLTGDDVANPTVNGKQTTDPANPKAGETDSLTSKSNFNLDVGSPLTGIMSYEKAGHYADVNNGDTDDTTYDNPGTGEWHYQFGTDSTKDTSIGLHVPSGTKRYEADYATTITWNLNLVP